MSAMPIASVSSTIPASSQGGSSGLQHLPTCEHCGRCHFGECMKKLSTCFRCGSDDHLLRDYLEPATTIQTLIRTPVRTQSTIQTSVGGRSQKRESRYDYDEPDMITCTITIHSISYFALFDNGYTHSYVSRSISWGLNIPVENIESSVIIQSLVYMMKLPLEEFNLFLVMGWLNKHRFNLDCETKRVILKTPDNMKIMMIEEHHEFLINVVSSLVAKRMIMKGSKAFPAYILDTRS
ncbi:uncharacterized protein LOC120162854 [Hibiscus syriacus]|uniref:uncharacterized protein LOC120162854 n=1 Tax=Hibiscus syriacus TaxID=106335 RepID=UPI0019207849|nr:uncharacterized protein LOC120162854 [Hibiscus syriacus]